jgi:hypothetical protein
MPHPSPSRAGFDLVIRRPALLFAEIAWRWSFGIAALALLGLTCVLFLSSVRVTDADMQLASSGSPWIAADVLARLLDANRAALLRALAVLIPGIAILWTIAAAIGRAMTTPPLIREGNGFSRATIDAERSPAFVAGGRLPSRTNFSALLGISFLRATLAVALIAGYFGCALIAAIVSNAGGGSPESQFGAALLIFLPLFLLLVLAWGALNWFFSIAPIFAVRDGRSTLASFADSVRLFAANKRDFVAIASAYGLAKTVGIIVVTVAGFILVAVLATLPKLLAIALIVITLAYFAFADLLNLARLASYAALAEIPATDPAAQTTSAVI